MTRNKGKKIKISYLILLFLISFLIISFIPNIYNKTGNNIVDNTRRKDDNLSQKQENPKLSLPTSDYEWWDTNWNFRIPIEISSGGDQQNAPVELQINFTSYLNDLYVENPWLDNESIRVVEYNSETSYTEIDCEFEELARIYDPQTNAIGDVVWILDGTTSAGTIREFFIYFNNGTDSGVALSETDLRIWHEGFEQYISGDIVSATSQDSHPNSWEISSSVSARGSSSLHIWGNTWKARSTEGAKFDNDQSEHPNARVTAKMRFDDPSPPQREVSGIGFLQHSYDYPSSSEFYNIRGNQYWGNLLYRNDYYAPSTFFWYTFTDIANDEYIIFIGDDDTYTERQLYWDDISAWDYPVQTNPTYMLSITTGNVEPIGFMLTIVALDENGKPVPSADIYITSDSQPSINQYDTSEDTGKAVFSEINQYDIYNITINYTQIGLPDPRTETVYFQENFQILTIDSTITAYLNLTTFEFNISYYNGDPLKYGFVYLKDGDIIVGKGVLNEIGNTTLRWINDTSYNYEVYFDYTALPYTASYNQTYLRLTDKPPPSASPPYINFRSDLYNVTFNVTEEFDQTPFLGAKLSFYNETKTPLSEPYKVAVVTVQANGFASFISFRTGYKDWKNYTITAYYGGENRFFDWDKNGQFKSYYNFSLDSNTFVDLRISLATKENYNTTIEVIDYTQESLWGTEFSFIFNFTWQSNEDPSPHLDSPDEISVQIFDADDNPFSLKTDILDDIVQISQGVFNYTFNTKQFGLIGGTSYYIEFSATYESYIPDDFRVSIDVLALPASITFHDYDTLLEVTSISQFFDELVNITIRYFSDDTGDPLLGATLNYEWNYGSGSINQDPLNPDYYTFTLDTGDAGSVGNPLIKIFASYENYTSYGDYPLVLQIHPRITSINNEINPFDKSYNIFVEQSFNLSFTLKDYTRDLTLGDLDQVFYEPYILNLAGGYSSLSENPVNLISKSDNSYLLDFDTENKGIGTYLLRLTMSKTNYETQKIDITYNILLRGMEADLSAKGLEDDQINIVKGNKVTLKVELSDTSEGGIPLRGAEVILDIGNDEFDFDEVEPGVYELEFDTDDYEAFFSSQTLTGTITITKPNYIAEEIELTIVIEMEEIMPGIPTFYFIMVVSAISAVVGSVVGYRVIQFARIPKFVKKIRGMKKAIKTNSSINESLLTDSKKETLLKLWGDDWNKIGLSLEDTLEFNRKTKGGKI